MVISEHANKCNTVGYYLKLVSHADKNQHFWPCELINLISRQGKQHPESGPSPAATLKCSEVFSKAFPHTRMAWQPLHAWVRAHFCEHPAVAKVTVAVCMTTAARCRKGKCPLSGSSPSACCVHMWFCLVCGSHIFKNIFPPPITSIIS